MAKASPFEIHVDPSCLSEDHEKENTMPAERVTSNETVVHHDSWGEKEIKAGQQTDEDYKQDSGHDEKDTREDEARERRIKKIEAEIQAAARAVVDSIEKNHFDNEDSLLSARTDESYDQEGSELMHEEGTELIYDEGTEASYESEPENRSEHNSEGAGDSSSHHDGDIDDDVFSSSNRSSARSSINSVHDLQDIDENQKLLTSPLVGEEAASSVENDISRVPSGSSYIRTGIEDDRTPSKVMNRPPFRTPSSVRAMQMGSPTQSIFSSPRSTKRHMPTVSRIGTPNSHTSPSKRTPTRFKVKKEYPLVLLHVTVMPLQWPFSHLMTSPEVPDCLHSVRESWKLLQNKLGDTVLERGVLLAHPQDSYEVLEERLLEALELPVRPRAKILKCGHYMGPIDSDVPSSDDELDSSWEIEKREASDWCDICRRNVRLEDFNEIGEPDVRFRIKFYASNGLMRAGAWAAAWREMERVDVEIEPFVEINLHPELEHLALITPIDDQPEKLDDEDDGFVDESMMIEDMHHEERQQPGQETPEEEVRMREEEVRSRLAEEEEMRQKMADDDRLRQLRIAEEEEMKQRFDAEERLKISQMTEELGIRQRMRRDDDMRRSMAEEDGMRDIYRAESVVPEQQHKSRKGPNRSGPEYSDIPTQSSQSNEHENTDMPRQNPLRNGVRGDETLPELLVAALKVAMRDSKNIAIAVLSLFVLFLALRPSTPVNAHSSQSLSEPPAVAHVTTTIYTEIVMASSPSLADAISTESSTASEASLLIVTETVPAPQITTTVFQERTVTEMAHIPSASTGVAHAEDNFLETSESTVESISENTSVSEGTESSETQVPDEIQDAELDEQPLLADVVNNENILEETEAEAATEVDLPFKASNYELETGKVDEKIDDTPEEESEETVI